MSDMTPEQLQHLIWGEPIVPNLPTFERHILNRYGKNISHKNEATVARNTRELNKLLNGYGKQPTKPNQSQRLTITYTNKTTHVAKRSPRVSEGAPATE
jgi:hypothetical protein